MSGIMKKIAALVLAIAMVVTLTPLYGMGAVAYAENEDVSAEQDASGEKPAAGDELSGEEAGNEDLEAPDEEEPVNEEPVVETGGDNGDEEEIVEEEPVEELPELKNQAGDLRGEGDPVLFDLERISPEKDWFFEDGTATFQLTNPAALEVEGVVSYVPYVGLGPDYDWAEIDPSCYEWDPDDMTIVLDGAKIAANIAANPEYDEVWKIFVQVKGLGPNAGPDDEDLRMLADSEIKFWATYSRYELPEDREVLPGWDGTIDGEYEAFVEDTAHPYGERVPVTVNSVSIKEGGEDLLKEWHYDNNEQGDYWWYYRAGEESGEVTFEIEYTDIEGNDQTHEFTLTIGDNVYESNMWTDGNVYVGLPGSQIEIYASAGRKFMNEYGFEEYTEEGIDFKWSFESQNADKYATLTVDEYDHSRATLTFKEVEDGDYDEVGCRVKVTIVDTDSDDPTAERSSQESWFSIRDEYTTIWPAELDPSLDVGQTIEDQQFELRHYKFDPDPEEGYNEDGFRLEDINSARWNFDKNAISITTVNGESVQDGVSNDYGDTFSFKRMRNWGTGMHLTVNDGEEYSTETDYWFFDKNYNLWFDTGGEAVYDDSEWTIHLQKEDFCDYSALDIVYRIECRKDNDEGEEEENWETAPEDCWEMSEDEMAVTVYGDKMAENGLREIRVYAVAQYEDENVGDEAECNLWLNDSCAKWGEEHLWLYGPPEYEDCYSPGWQKKMCWNCGEKAIEEVPARGHIATVVNAKAATASKEGNVKYWKCADCGKCFSDAKCTKEVTADSRIIPKGTAISKVTAQKKGFTVTWKKPTGTFLKHTTGYEVQYALDSKFKKSAKTVAITKNGTVSRKVTGLKAKTKYFVRVRTYRTIDGKKSYGPWSAVKNIKTK